MRNRRIPTEVIGVVLVLGIAAAQVPNAEDLAWQHAAAPYDAARNAILKHVDDRATHGPFHPEWASLQKYRVPDWYLDAKFGIFIHWGVYSVPAFGNEWYPRNMYVQGSPEFNHHVATFGPQIKFGYKDFIPQFKAEHFDPDAWAHLFRDAGAKYVIPVAEHHDGFAMYDSGVSAWTAAKMGPKRDIVGELARSVRAAGLHFGASSHRAEHYFFLNPGRDFPSDVDDPRNAAFYGPAHAGVNDKNGAHWLAHPDPAYLNDWLARSSEIVTKYHPEVMWFDWWINTKEFAPYLQKFAAFYYNDAAKRNSTAVINYKQEAFPDGAAVLDIERGQLDASRNLFWQTDTSVSIKSWGYIKNDTFRTPESMIQQLVDIVSKNGCLLLNIGPKPDGTIPDEAQKILLSMGRWLKVNGEAIYRTRPWKVYGEGPTQVAGGAFHDTATKGYTSRDIRFTANGDNIYAIAMAWPDDGKLVIQSLGEFARPEGVIPIKSVHLLGSDATIKWTRGANELILELPKQKSGEYAYVFKIQTK